MSTKREIRDYLSDILESISDLRTFTEGLDFDAFCADRKTINACIRCLEVIGEATKKIPEATRQMKPDLPWREIAGMRDKLIHEYFGVDLQIIWQTINHDLTPFEQAIATLQEQQRP